MHEGLFLDSISLICMSVFTSIPHYSNYHHFIVCFEIRKFEGYVRGVCSFLSSVSLQQRFEMVDHCYSLIMAQNFILQAKESTLWKLEGRPTPKERSQSILACLLPVLSMPYANWVSQEGDVFVSPKVITPVHGFSFVPFLQAFLYLCLLATTILDSFPLF